MRNVFKRYWDENIMRPNLKTPVSFGVLNNPQFGAVLGPTFDAPIEQAVLRSKLSRPWQVLCGYAYPVARQFNVLQPPPPFAPKAVTLAGIGIQQGTFVTSLPATGEYGDFLNEQNNDLG